METKQRDEMGMLWWNGCTRLERVFLLDAAEVVLGRHPAPVDAWELWNAGLIRMDGGAVE